MNETEFTDDLFSFLDASPTPFHAVSVMAARFRSHGFHELSERDSWNVKKGQSYFVIRDDGALIAFTLGRGKEPQGFRMLGAHTDSPSLQVKPLPDIGNLKYRQLGIEVYGGALLNPWFDRALSLAGRVCCRMTDDSLQTLLLDFRRPLLLIPSLAIHFDREANKSKSINAQQHLTPIFSQAVNEQFPDFTTILLEQIRKEYPGLNAEEVLGFDMFCYDPQPPGHVGHEGEFICAGRLDNLVSCFVGMRAMVDAGKNSNRMFICNNHEEIGSASASGALGTLPAAIWERLFPDMESRQIALRKSFFISMDNAHAVHPNFADKSESSHQVFLNGGPVIKVNANQRYATTGFSKAFFQLLAKEAGVATQEFVMRNDMACGSTIGPLISSQLGLTTVDVGVPSLAMHSIRETTGARDPLLLYLVIRHFLARKSFPGEKDR